MFDMLRNKDMNIATLIRWMDIGKVDFNIPEQRGYVWGDGGKRNGKLIHSILIGFPIGLFYFNHVLDHDIYEGIDGKQRANAMYTFVNDGYKLPGKTPAVRGDEGNLIKVAGKIFSQLPEELKQRILQCGLKVYCFDDMSIEEKIEFFDRINSGRKVTANDIARINIKSRKVFVNLAENSIVPIVIGSAAAAQCVDEDIIKSIWAMNYYEKSSLLTEDLGPILKDNEVTSQQNQELKQVLDYMKMFFTKIMDTQNRDLFKKIRSKKTQIVALGHMAYLAIQKGMSPEEYSEKAIFFFTTESGMTISERYNKASISGTSQAKHVIIRKDELNIALILQ